MTGIFVIRTCNYYRWSSFFSWILLFVVCSGFSSPPLATTKGRRRRRRRRQQQQQYQHHYYNHHHFCHFISFLGYRPSLCLLLFANDNDDDKIIAYGGTHNNRTDFETLPKVGTISTTRTIITSIRQENNVSNTDDVSSNGNSNKNNIVRETKRISKIPSSIESFADSIGLTVDEIRTVRDRYKVAKQQLHEVLMLQSSSSSSRSSSRNNVKHNLHCQHRFQYGRQPFVCAKCWSYQPICICTECDKYRISNKIDLYLEDISDTTAKPTNTSDVDQIITNMPSLPILKTPMNSNFRVIIWTHHKEWGTPSNTGCILPLVLPSNKCSMLMKGLPEHDQLLMELLHLNDLPAPSANNQEEIQDETSLPMEISPSSRIQKIATTTTTTIASSREPIIIPVVLWMNSNDTKTKSFEDSSSNVSNTADNTIATNMTSMFDTSSSNKTADRIPNFVTIEQLKEQIRHVYEQEGNDNVEIVIIALEGTWRNARRMFPKLVTMMSSENKNILRCLHIRPEHIFGWRKIVETQHDYQNNSTRSILHPLRKKGNSVIRNKSNKTVQLHNANTSLYLYNSDDSNSNNNSRFGSRMSSTTNYNVSVCTAEAVVSTLVMLSMIQPNYGQQILDLVQLKISRTVQYQGKVQR